MDLISFYCKSRINQVKTEKKPHMDLHLLLLPSKLEFAWCHFKPDFISHFFFLHLEEK